MNLVSDGGLVSNEQRLTALGLSLPAAPKPVANYVPAVLAGELLFLSGVLPSRDGQVQFVGKVGRDLTVEQGSEAARMAILNALAIVRAELGTLDRVRRIVRLTGHVASASGFEQQPAVMNGASDVLVQVFGESGRHTRIAVGAAELPRNAAVELDLIVQVAP